ncbi:MAG TPA: hypothetical protein ENH05_04485 [Rhizobiales bacterium]|nr:chromosome partition protein Smc [bacterium BMS3Bbin10]HDO51978.1 hypothetical protein [Hyphomicrobiales bacterium]
MKGDDKDPPGADSKKDGAPGKPKRPSRVIDLEAAEVEVEDQPDGAPGQGGDDGTGTPERGAEAGATSVPRVGGSSAGASSGAPRQRTKPSDIKGFVTHLAAGLAGGLIGVIGAGVALDRLPLDAARGAPPDTAPAIEKFEQRLNALDARLAEQAKSILAARQGEASANGEALKTLQQRLAALESRPEAPPPDLQPLTDRLEKLEGTLKTLQASGGEDGASGLAQSAALTGKIAEVSQQLERRAAALGQEIAGLKSALEARVPRQGEGSESLALLVETRLEALENSIAKLASRPPPPPAQTSSRSDGAALALAFEILRRTIDRGEPFGAQLKALEEAAPAGLDLSALAAHASAGIPTDGALLAALALALRAARQAAAGPEGDTFLDRLVSNARSVVRVRRLGPAEGTSAAAVLSRMEAHMEAADLAGVLRQGEALSGAALKSLQPWLEKARAQRMARAKLAEIERGLLAGLQSRRGADKSR